MFKGLFSQSNSRQEKSRDYTRCPSCSQSWLPPCESMVISSTRDLNESGKVYVLSCALCEKGSVEVAQGEFLESQLYLIREQISQVVADCPNEFYNMIIWGDLYYYIKSLKGENSDLPIEKIALSFYRFRQSALKKVKEFEEKQIELVDKEVEITDLKNKITDLEQEILNFEEKILNLNREKSLLEWDKNEQIALLEKQIEELESTIALLEKAPEDLLEAQLNFYSTIYPEIFAQLEQNISEEKKIEISDFISFLVKKIADTKTALALREEKIVNLEKELRIISQDLTEKVSANNLLAKKNSRLLK